MTTKLVLKMTWRHGGAKIISCTDLATVEEIAIENGFVPIPSQSPTFVSGGRILLPQFTLRWNEIKSGATIVAHHPAYLSWRSPSVTEWAGQGCPLRLPPTCADEAARMIDRGFLQWETGREFPLALAELLKEEEAADEENRIEALSWPTIVRPSTAISDAPLPLLTPGTRWRESM
jgi:hypothetical protein